MLYVFIFFLNKYKVENYNNSIIFLLLENEFEEGRTARQWPIEKGQTRQWPIEKGQ